MGELEEAVVEAPTEAEKATAEAEVIKDCAWTKIGDDRATCQEPGQLRIRNRKGVLAGRARAVKNGTSTAVWDEAIKQMKLVGVSFPKE